MLQNKNGNIADNKRAIREMQSQGSVYSTSQPHKIRVGYIERRGDSIIVLCFCLFYIYVYTYKLVHDGQRQECHVKHIEVRGY